MARLMLVDDDPALIQDQLAHLFSPQGIQLDIVRNGRAALEQIIARPPDVVLLDISMPGLSGLEVYQQMRQVDSHIPVIFITASTTTDAAIEAMRLGAYDYLLKPVDLRQLEATVSKAIELSLRMRSPAVMGEALVSEAGGGIIGRSHVMVEVYKAIGRVSDQKVMVLITGESGTGKELVARAIYEHSERAKAPYLAINCAAIPENLLESELFGHEKGAFSGADRRRIGKFEQCSGGTIFLDEIGDMPLATQGKVLRLLQDQKFERIGGNETIQTDVRLIAATNRDLKTWSEAGRFRSDLYYRLSVFTIDLPPLRRRMEDLPLLVAFFLRRFNKELNRQVHELSPEAMQRLRSYRWPGNIRELQGMLKQALLRSQGSVLMPEALPELSDDDASKTIEGGFSFESLIDRRLDEGSTDLNGEVHLQLDRILLTRTLRYTQGNQLDAAKILGIARQTLRNRLRELGLNISKSIDGAPPD